MLKKQVGLVIHPEIKHEMINLIVDKDDGNFYANEKAIDFILLLSGLDDDAIKSGTNRLMAVLASYETHLSNGGNRCEHSDRLVRYYYDDIRSITTFTSILEGLNDDGA